MIMKQLFELGDWEEARGDFIPKRIVIISVYP